MRQQLQTGEQRTLCSLSRAAANAASSGAAPSKSPAARRSRTYTCAPAAGARHTLSAAVQGSLTEVVNWSCT